MEPRTRKQKAWKQIAVVMMLAGAALTGAVVLPAFQPNGVQVTYADCDGGAHNPPIIDCGDPTPTPTATPDPEHP
ncbi:MAG: hypothetical protein ABIQ44_00070 [Chloroflexia bacterium]